jgi:flagellar hook-associated protein 2
VTDLSPIINFGGLASGMDTNTMVDQLMSIERQPETRLRTEQAQTQQRKTDLQSIEQALKDLQFAAEDLKSPALWLDTQSVDVNDPTKIAATRTGGAGTGGYSVTVSQLASASQHWFTYPGTPPASDDVLTVGGHAITIPAGSDAGAAANAVNSDSDSPVYASAIERPGGGEYLAFSSKATGRTSDFTVTDSSGFLTEDASRALIGLNAEGTVGTQPFDETGNVVADAIPGVSLTLKGVTAASAPVAVTVGAPQPDEDAIAAKVRSFVDRYNATVELVRKKLEEAPVVNPQTVGDQLKGGLYSDPMLDGLLDRMRTAVYESLGTDLGISTGQAVGSGGLNQDAIAGKLVFDQAKFTQASESDPRGTRDMVSGFAQAFDDLLQPAVGAEGTIDQSITSTDSEYRGLADQLASMDELLAQKQEMLKKQFADMETALQQSQAAGAQVAGQLASLGG